MRSKNEILADAEKRIENMEHFERNGMLKPYQQTDLALFKELVALIEQPQWIPCSERLPIIEDEPSDYAEDVGRRFLITDSDGYVYESTFWKYANVFNDNAIAWQPLPTPYKGEQE